MLSVSVGGRVIYNPLDLRRSIEVYSTYTTLKARTHSPIFTRSGVESAVESVDSKVEPDNSYTNFIIVSPRSSLNMFDMLEQTGISQQQLAYY